MPLVYHMGPDERSGRMPVSCHLRKYYACWPNDCFLIRKRPLRMAPMNGRFWPKAAVALKPSRMSELGQERTFGDTIRKVCCWG